MEEEDAKWRKAEEDRRRQELEAKKATAELNITRVRKKKAVLQAAIDARKKKFQLVDSADLKTQLHPAPLCLTLLRPVLHHLLYPALHHLLFAALRYPEAVV